jgi:cytochrome d ubiquinol oxidase subunit I
LPFLAALAGWVLTEMGRQPWIVQGLLQTSEANSPNVSEAMLVGSLTVIVLLYAALLVVDVWLMRRYARYDPEPAVSADEVPQPVLGY